MKYVWNPSFTAALNLNIRKKNHSSDPLICDFLDQPEIAKVLLDLVSLTPKQRSRLDVLPPRFKKHQDFLLELGVFVSENEVPRPVLPNLGLSLKLLPFVSKSARSEAQGLIAKQVQWQFNQKYVRLQEAWERPLVDIEGVPPARDFPVSKNLVWIYDLGNQMWTFYQISSKTKSLIKKIQENPNQIQKLSENEIELFWHARILITPSYLNRRMNFWKNDLLRVQKTLKQEEYGVVRGMVNDLFLAAAKTYFRKLEQEGYLSMDKDQVVQKRFTFHNDPVLRFLHRQSGNLLRRITDQAVIPSYSMLSAYLQAADLEKHVDRPQCAWNCSVLLDWNPEGSLKDSWPIYIETKKAVREVHLALGDSVIYRGTDVPHWRLALKQNQRQTLGLLHYVPIHFTGSLD